MEKKVSAFSAALPYGLLAGVISIILSLVYHILDIDYELARKLGMVGWLITAIVMVYGMIQHRNKNLGGFMTFGQSFGIGFFIGLIASILGAIFTYVYMAYINPDMINLILEQSEEQMVAQGNMTDEQIEMTLQWTERMVTPTMSSIWGLVVSVIVYTIVSLVVSFFTKRENPAQG